MIGKNTRTRIITLLLTGAVSCGAPSNQASVEAKSPELTQEQKKQILKERDFMKIGWVNERVTKILKECRGKEGEKLEQCLDTKAVKHCDGLMGKRGTDRKLDKFVLDMGEKNGKVDEGGLSSLFENVLCKNTAYKEAGVLTKSQKIQKEGEEAKKRLAEEKKGYARQRELGADLDALEPEIKKVSMMNKKEVVALIDEHEKLIVKYKKYRDLETDTKGKETMDVTIAGLEKTIDLLYKFVHQKAE